MTKAKDWPMWLQIALGVPNAVGLVWAFLWTPKTQKGLICVYAFLAYIFLFQILFVWQSPLGYLVAAAVGLGLGIAVFLRARNAGYWPRSSKKNPRPVSQTNGETRTGHRVREAKLLSLIGRSSVS